MSSRLLLFTLEKVTNYCPSIYDPATLRESLNCSEPQFPTCWMGAKIFTLPTSQVMRIKWAAWVKVPALSSLKF